MKCDKCQAEFAADEMFRNDLKLVSGPPNGDFFRSLGVAALLDQDPPKVLTNWLCKECFGKVYRRQSLGCLVALSIGLGLAILFIVSLIMFGKWDTQAQRMAAGSVSLFILIGLFLLMWIVTIRRYKRLEPTPADKFAVFGPFYTASLKALAQQGEPAKLTVSAAPVVSAEAAVEQQAEFFRSLGLKVVGLEEAKAAARQTDEARAGLAGDPFFAYTVDRLLALYTQHPQGFVQSVGGAAAAEVRGIGRRLNDLGGKDLMLAAHADFASRCAIPGAARNLETMWDGIGSWLG